MFESQYVSKLVKKLSEIKRKECKDITTNYVERKVLQVGINDYFNTENRENLYEVLKNNSKVVLLSNAGEGKTEEAKRIVNLINEKEKKQYEIVKNKLNELFYKNKDYDDIGLVSYIIKEIEDLYCKQNQSVMSIENIKQSIKQFDEQMQNNEIRDWI